MREEKQQLINRLPESVRREINAVPGEILDGLQEIRLRANQRVKLYTGEKEYMLGMKIDNAVLNQTVNNLLNYSYYAYEEELSKGFVTIEGGHRVGICGRVVTENEGVRLIKEFSSINLRYSREIIGCSDELLPRIMKTNGIKRSIYNTLIVSPPKCGKTTLLRDIARSLSYSGFKVAVCDERSELAGMYLGAASFDMGPNTDILDGCSKTSGIPMLIRSMAPDVIITDEIGRSEDIKAAGAAACAGICLITSIHGENYEDVIASPIGELLERHFFKKLVFLGNTPSTGTVLEVRDV